MKNNHMELLNLSFNGRLKNYYKDDGTYHDYNVGDLLMVEDKRQSGDKYVEVGIFTNYQWCLYQQELAIMVIILFVVI